ncbi:hypothetical protein ACTMS0_15495 [Micromonospora sp. H33]|uniref:hypothetical protein n=1 Tax=Micromonospora sp. H33 TaxID=3452215 RepID=UPI003F8C29E1
MDPGAEGLHLPRRPPIGVVVFSSDQEYTLLPLGGTRLRVVPDDSDLPVVGGRAVLGF